MADEMRVNMVTGNDPARDSGHGPSKLPWIVLAVVIVVLVLLGILFRNKLFNGNSTTAGTSGKASGYQAVFLTNGQVYFGKLDNTDEQYATLKDIYYLQVTTPPGLQGSTSQANSAAQQAQQQLSLVKLGQELHGPVDSMQINRDQVLFYEDMKEDGKVVQAIREYQKNPPANNQSTAPAANSATGQQTAPATGIPQQTPAAPIK